MNVKKILFKGFSWTVFGVITRSSIQLLQIIILVRFLPKESFGLLALAIFLVEFTNIFVEMGFTSAILHFQNATNKQYSSVYWFNILIGLVFFVLIYFAAPLIANFYEQSTLNDIIPILGLTLIINTIGKLHRTLLQKDFQFKTINIIESVSYIIGLIISIYLVFNDFQIFSLIYANLIKSLISNIGFLLASLRKYPIIFTFSFNDITLFLKVGIYTLLSTILEFLSRQVDILIIGKILGLEILGVYSLCKQIVIKIFQLINPIASMVITPLLSKFQDEKNKLKKYYLDFIRYSAYLNFLVYLIVIVLSQEILFYLYGPSFTYAYPTFMLIAYSYCLKSINYPVGCLQVATGRTDLGFKWSCLRVIITPLILMLGSWNGINGMMISYLIFCLVSIVIVWYMQIQLMINTKLTEYINQFILPLIISIVIILGSLFYNFKLENYILLNLFIKLIITSICFGSFIYLTNKKHIKKFAFFLKGTKY